MFVFWGYSAFTLYLLATGEITRFISPRLVWLAYFSGFSLGLFLLVLSMRETNRHKEKIWKEAAKGILLIYPIILFFIVKPSDISSVNIPAVKTIPAQRPAIKKSTPVSLPVDIEGYVRLNLFELWLLARNYPELAQRYRVKTIGMVSNVSEKYLTLSRLFMTCCAADAMPVEVEIASVGKGVPQKSQIFGGENDNKQSFSKGDWLEVSGAIIIRDYVIIVPDSMNVLQKQAEAYITRWSEEPPFNP
jgi:uncharacterized membrane protein YcgQ (UPF0703/DUF1980 family)